MYRTGRHINYAMQGLTAIREVGGRDAAQAQAGHTDGAVTETIYAKNPRKCGF